LALQGARRIVIMPYFLTMGIHLKEDLPRILDSIAQRHPGIELHCTAPLDGHPGLIDAITDRALPFFGS
jgi:sirohydrochlorin cobaltochelatase